MDYIVIAAAAATIGLLFLILNGIITTYNYKTRAVINLFFGLILVIAFSLSFYLDYKVFLSAYKKINYYSFIISSLLITIILFVIYFKKGINNRQKLFSKRIKTVLDKKDFLYLIYKYQDIIYLETKNHSGLIYKLRPKDFHDDIIVKNTKKMGSNITDEDFEKIGTYTIKDKKDTVFHCYLITLKEPLINNEYTGFDKREIINLEFSKLDRQIIFRILLREKFAVEKDRGE